MPTTFRRSLSAWALAVATAALLASAPAAAGGRGNGYYDHPGYGHGYGYGKHRGYDRHYHHHRKHRRGRGNDGAYLLGGIVIGSLLTHALTAPPRAYAAPPPQTVRYYDAAPARRLFRDINGNCFERRDDGYGRELLVELPYRECAW